ncbi:MAG: O-antigen ligase family protein [Anaerolineae bacterium]
MTFVRNRPHPILYGIVITFLLIPIWYRLPRSPFLSPLYVTRFLILLPVVWTIGVWLLTGVPGLREFLRDKRRVGWGLALLLLGLVAYCSQSWAFMRQQHPEVAATAALQFTLVVLFAFVVACSKVPARALIAALAFGVLWNALLTFAQTANQGSIGLNMFGEFGMTANSSGASVVVSGDLRWLRPYGLLPHPNVLAGFFVVGLLATISWITSPNRRLRWSGTALFLLGLWALLLTFSRGAWLGLAAAVFALYPLIRRHLNGVWRHIFITAGLIVAMGIAFVILYRPLLSARAGEGSENVELRSISDRTVYTYYALEAVYENPLLGVGIGNFPWRSSYYLWTTDFDLRGDNVHHVMLSAMAELGVVGFTLLTAALVFGVEAALHTLRSADDARERACLLAGVLALGVIGLLDHYPWTMLHMQLAWWGLLAAALRSPTTEPLPQIPDSA